MEALPPLADVELLGTGDPLVAALVPAGGVEGVSVVHTHRVDAPRLADNHRQRLVTPTPSRPRFGTAKFGNPWTQA